MFGSITILDLWKNLSRDSKNNWLFLGFILFGILSFFSILVSAQCIGYVQGDVCYAIGDEVVENGVRYYADIGGVLTGKKIVGTSCNNDFECLNNLCSNGECVDLYGEVEGNRGVIEAIEDVEINNMEISLATLKDNYRIGEQIKLTDPPSDEIINNEPNQNNIDSLNDNRIINNGIENIIVHDSNSAYTKEYNNDIDDSLIGRSQIDSIENINGEIINQDEEFEGYIVEFEDDPIIVEKVNLEERAERNEEIIENNPILTTISGYRYFGLREEEVPQEIEEYREDLERDNERIKDRIANELSVELGSNNPFSDFFISICHIASSRINF